MICIKSDRIKILDCDQNNGIGVCANHPIQLHRTRRRQYINVSAGVRLVIVAQNADANRLQASIGSGADSKARLQKIEDMLPMKRVTEPEDIANAVWYLASDQSSFVTGTTLEVDGGRGV